jgi:iron complex transport system permease protein
MRVANASSSRALLTHKRIRRILWGLAGLLLALFAISLLLGRYPKPYWMPPSLLVEDPLARALLLSLRLPRLISAMLMGMALAAAGAVLQMVFRNPLVEPGFLGVSQGAAFGASLSILFLARAPLVTETVAAFFAMLGLLLSYFVARRIRYGGWVLRLVLSGIAITALFAAGTGILKYLADPLSQLPEITFWLLGGLWGITWKKVLFIAPFVAVGLFVVILMRWRLNLLALSDETAFSLGTAPARERTILLAGAVVATAAVTSVGGVVAWIGLIIPHIARRLMGADARYTIPASLLLGGLFTILCDDLARTLLPGEIPLGIITSLLGAVVFILLMASARLRVRA